jgi:hypothetical protein
MGDTPHHYYLSVIAKDIEPNALMSGFNRDALVAAIKDHSLVAQSYGGVMDDSRDCRELEMGSEACQNTSGEVVVLFGQLKSHWSDVNEY